MTGPVRIERHEFAIPEDVQPGKGWSPVMLAMAAHIGAYDVLRLCEAYGGQVVYFSRDLAKAPFADVIGPEKAERLAIAFQLEKIALPTGRHAFAALRRESVLASVREGTMTVAEAAAMLGLRRDTISSQLKSGEGSAYVPAQPIMRNVDPRQLDMFAGE